jgi:hypothetical protein
VDKYQHGQVSTKIKPTVRHPCNQLQAELSSNLPQELLEMVASDVESKNFRYGTQSREVITIVESMIISQAVQLKDTAATLIASQSWHGGCAEHSPACLRWLCCAWHGGCTESVLEARLLAGELCRLKQRLRSSHPSECNWTSWSDILSQRLIKQTTTDRL